MTATLPYQDCVHTTAGHLLFCLPDMVKWDGISGFWCLHASAFDGDDWVVTFREQDNFGYLRWRASVGAPSTDPDPARHAENYCLHLPGVVVGHIVADADDDTPAAFTQQQAAEVFATASQALWKAAALCESQMSLQPPLPLPVPSGEMWQIAAIPPHRREGTLAEAMGRLTQADVGNFLSDFLNGDTGENP